MKTETNHSPYFAPVVAWLECLVQDVRFATRTMRKNPGFTGVVALTLGAGIALNTSLCTFYVAVALKPLAVRGPEEIVRVVETDGARTEIRFSQDEFEQIGAKVASFAATLAISSPQFISATQLGNGTTPPKLLTVRFVSDNYFSALGVIPFIGRSFGPGDGPAGVLSHAFWQRYFAGDGAVAGRTLTVHGLPVTVLGVAPESFAGTGLPANTPDLWLPLSLLPAVMPGSAHRDARQWQILARLKRSASIEEAEAELDRLARNRSAPGGRTRRLVARAATFFQTDSGEFQAFKTIILIVSVGAGAILLIGCGNVVNLLLARNAAREHELAVRIALGASRGRLVRLLCTESVLLGLLGGAGGLLMSYWCCGIVRTWLVETFKRLSAGAIDVFLNVTPDWHVFAYTLALSLLAGVAVGIWPAWRATRGEVEVSLKLGSSGIGDPTRGLWSRRNLLLSSQVAGSVLLLAGAGLAIRGAWHARTTDPGYDTRSLFVLAPNLDAAGVEPAARVARTQEIITRLESLREVGSVAWASHPPFLGHSIVSMRKPDGTLDRWVFNRVSNTFFDTVGLRFVAGRTFTKEELENGDLVAIVNETAARQMWPGQAPIGQFITERLPSWMLRDGARGSPIKVVGVVEDARLTVLSKVDRIDVFLPEPIGASGTLLVRVTGGIDEATQAILAALGAIDVNLPAQTIMLSLEQGGVQVQRLMIESPAVVATALGCIALLLASVGTYGVVSFLVARRTREIGVRIALGARARDVVGMILSQTLRPAMWGAGVGVFGAIGLSVLLVKVVVGPELPDFVNASAGFPWAVLLTVVGVVSAVVLIATMIPVRRATQVDPVVALRCG